MFNGSAVVAKAKKKDCATLYFNWIISIIIKTNS